MIRRLLGPQNPENGQEREPADEVARTPTPGAPPTGTTSTGTTSTGAPPKQTKEANVSQRPEPISELRSASPRSAEQTVTVIGNGARLEGNLISAASLRIEGSVTGTITADGDVIIAPEAEVAADIKATNATLGGRFKGNAVVTGTMELTSTARVEGNLTSRSLVVSQGALFSGQSIMDTGLKKAASGPTPVPSLASGPKPAAPVPPKPE
ncbi:MAG TPA: polymer-forming cytoskeletal protein [Actinomycetota bacterium]|nr:polymer-forming cytoskeletal protein [Actinomycetota bacterium]